MCCGASESAPVAVDAFGRPEPELDTDRYLVSYFNGTTQEVTGLEEVRKVLLNPAVRAEGTDENGFQGGSYAKIT